MVFLQPPSDILRNHYRQESFQEGSLADSRGNALHFKQREWLVCYEGWHTSKAHDSHYTPLS